MDQSAFIIFRWPRSSHDVEHAAHVAKEATFAAGAHNKRLVADILRYNGLCETKDGDFTLMWGSSPIIDAVSSRSVHQKLCHFPYSKKVIGNKAELAMIIQSNPRVRDFPVFFPKTFVLPRDRSILYRMMRSDQSAQFIAKPPMGSCGQGIKLVTFSDFHAIPQNSVVSQYVSRPLCIDGFKFDLRIYVLVTSFAPLRAFVYKEGLARFATESYSNLSKDVYSHLTNATLNKHGRNWCDEFKWKLSDLLQEMKHRWKKAPAEIMKRIHDTVAMTLALVQPVMSPTEKRSAVDPFFEIYGFDLLLDEDFNMWLLEVNTFPSLACDRDVDFDVKRPLVAQALSIVGIPDMNNCDLDKFDSQLAGVSTEEILKSIIEGEDERNVASGNGFTRIFPSRETQWLQSLLTIPKFVIEKKIGHKRAPVVDPLKYAKELTAEQAMDVLVGYLGKMHRQLVTGDAPDRMTERVVRFLAAQGFRVPRRPSDINDILKSFIDRQRARSQLLLKRTELPDSIKNTIVGASDDFVAQVLLNSNVSVRNLRTLFY